MDADGRKKGMGSDIPKGAGVIAAVFVLLSLLGMVIQYLPVPELDGWHTAAGQEIALDAQQMIPGSKTRTLHAVLPQDAAGKVLVVRSEGIRVRIRIGATPLYTTPGSIFGSCPGDHLAVVTLPEGSGGAELTLECSAVLSLPGSPVRHVYIGEAGSLLPGLVLRSLPGTLVGGALVFAGLLVIYISEVLFQPVGRRLHRPLTWLGLFITALSVWCFTQLDVVLLSRVPAVLVQLFTYGSLSAAAGALFCYLADSVHSGRIAWLAQGMGRASFVWAGLTFLLDLSFIVPYVYSIYLTQVLLVTACAGTLALLLEPVRRHMPVSYTLLGYGMFVLSAGADLIRMLAQAAADHALYTRAGLLALVLGAAADSARQGIGSIQRAAAADTLQQAAYLDALTGVYNRRAYERDSTLFEAAGTRAGIVMMDVNNLKRTNDNFGHEQGDALIRAAARVIRQAFEGRGVCYRYGGDEFIVLVAEAPEAACPGGIDALSHLCAGENRDRGAALPPLSIAAGWALYLPGHEGTSFANTQRLADEQMYRNKREMKERMAAAGHEAQV